MTRRVTGFRALSIGQEAEPRNKTKGRSATP